MKWLKYVCFLSLGLGVVMNLEHLVEDVASEQDSPLFQPQDRPQPSKKRAPAQVEQKYGVLEPKFVDVYEAVLANPPEGRNWEHLPQDEFLEAVEEWVDEILLAANLSISDPKAKVVGDDLFKYKSPYLQYIGFTLVYRNGLSETVDIENHFLKLSSHTLMHDLYVEDLEMSPHEHQVRHKLVMGLIEVYGHRLLSNIHQNVSEEEWQDSRVRMTTELEKVPDDYTRMLLSTAVENIY